MADSVKCWENYNIFGSSGSDQRIMLTLMSTGHFVYHNCPGAQKNTFIYAPKVLEAKDQRSRFRRGKEYAYIDKLIESYDMRLKYFPGKDAYVIGEKGSKTLKYKKDHEAAYETFKQAYETDFNLMTPAQINGYFLSTVKMYNDDKKVDLQGLIHVYLVVMKRLPRTGLT